MRKCILILLAFAVLFSMTACSPSENTPSSSTSEAPESENNVPAVSAQADIYIFYDEVYDYTLEFPMDFWNELTIEEYETGLNFCHKASYDAGYGGRLFSISVRTAEDAQEIPTDMYTNLGEQNGLMYMMFKPTDVQFDPETMEAYDVLMLQVDRIVQTFRFGKV